MDGHPVHSRTSFVGLDSCQCLLAVFPLTDFLHQLFANGRAFCPALRPERFGPFRRALRGFTPILVRKASTSWLFCRLSLMSRAAYSPLPSTLAGTVRAFITCVTTMPSADFCPPVRIDRSTTSVRFRDKRQISRGKFDRLPRTTAGFTTCALDGYGLRCHLPARPAPYASYPVLVHRLAPLLHASFRPRLATTPLRFASFTGEIAIVDAATEGVAANRGK